MRYCIALLTFLFLALPPQRVEAQTIGEMMKEDPLDAHLVCVIGPFETGEHTFNIKTSSDLESCLNRLHTKTYDEYVRNNRNRVNVKLRLRGYYNQELYDERVDVDIPLQRALAERRCSMVANHLTTSGGIPSEALKCTENVGYTEKSVKVYFFGPEESDEDIARLIAESDSLLLARLTTAIDDNGNLTREVVRAEARTIRDMLVANRAEDKREHAEILRAVQEVRALAVGYHMGTGLNNRFMHGIELGWRTSTRASFMITALIESGESEEVVLQRGPTPHSGQWYQVDLRAQWRPITLWPLSKKGAGAFVLLEVGGGLLHRNLNGKDPETSWDYHYSGGAGLFGIGIEVHHTIASITVKGGVLGKYIEPSTLLPEETTGEFVTNGYFGASVAFNMF